MLKPRAGDKITVEGVVETVSDDGVTFTFRGSDYHHVSLPINVGFITHIEYREPMIGDEIVKINDVIHNFRYTVLAVHGSGDKMTEGRLRRWVVAAYKDDLPQVFMVNEIQCVD